MVHHRSVFGLRTMLLVYIIALGFAYSPPMIWTARVLPLRHPMQTSLLQPVQIQHRTPLCMSDGDSFGENTLPKSNTELAGSVQQQIEKIINTNLLTSELRLHSMKWRPGKLELSLSKAYNSDDSSPQLDELEAFHQQLYTELESDPVIDQFLEKCDIIISTPGLSDVLSTDRDFVTFQGFAVNVQTTEEFKQATTTSGTLVKRTADHVVLSQKGKVVSIPRGIVLEVRLPPALREPGDPGY